MVSIPKQFCCGAAALSLFVAVADSLGAGLPVSGSDEQVRVTTLAVDASGERVILFWESAQFTKK